MCGIVGYVGRRSVSNVVMVGLERLEYRGYDSCGIAVVDGGLKLKKTAGRLQQLKDILGREPMRGSLGIGHTRWATHGRVTDDNAHPFTDCTRTIALVHNGIIENYRELRERLKAEGHRFVSSTDTEVVVHLVESHYAKQTRPDLAAAVRRAAADLKGSFALALVSEREPDRIVAVRVGSPLVVGQGRSEHIVASDATALVGIGKRMLALHDGEIAVVTRESCSVSDLKGRRVERPFSRLELKSKAVSKGRYPHFMRKEIFEQPHVIAGNIERRFAGGLPQSGTGVQLDPEFLFYPDEIERLERIVIQACGTSYHAGLVGRYYFEKLCRIPCSVEISSELRSSEYLYDASTFMIPISQSGETADTLAALREGATRGIKSLAVLNTRRSSIDRESHSTVYIHAGPEIGVASSKAYTAQVFTLLAIALHFARVRGALDDRRLAEIVEQCRALPELMRRALALDRCVKETAARLSFAHDFIFLGRGINYPSALEGALKLKEVSYVHATGYPAGEMKHGPISLITESVPVIGIAPRDSVYDKMVSNLAEAKARQGRIIAVGTEGDEDIAEMAETVLYIPPTPELLSPIVTALPLQLLAYHVAVLRGCDVDKPRNLAKSVTVE